MPEEPQSQPRRHLVRKDDGSQWVVTYGGKGKIKWERYEGADDLDGAVAQPPQSDAWRDALSDLIAQIAIAARPYAESWVQTRVFPFLKQKWRDLTTKKPEAEPVASGASKEIASNEPVEAEGQYRYRMTSAEAQQHREDLEILAQLTALKVRMLTNAEIADEPNQGSASILEHHHAEEQRITHELAEQITEALQSEIPLIGPGNPDRAAWILTLMGYQVQELSSVEEQNAVPLDGSRLPSTSDTPADED